MCTIVKSNENCDPTGLIGATIGEVCVSYAIIHCLGPMKERLCQLWVDVQL